MDLASVKNIWSKLKNCLLFIISIPISSSSNNSIQQHVSRPTLQKIAKTHRVPVKKYSFKQFECSVDSDCQKHEKVGKKTKMIKKGRKVECSVLFHVDELISQESIPHFFDENGVEVSSISMKSEQDSFGLEDFHEIFKWELQTKDHMRKSEHQESDQRDREKGRKWKKTIGEDGHRKSYGIGRSMKRKTYH